jgi:hypothetical protein
MTKETLVFFNKGVASKEEAYSVLKDPNYLGPKLNFGITSLFSNKKNKTVVKIETNNKVEIFIRGENTKEEVRLVKNPDFFRQELMGVLDDSSFIDLINDIKIDNRGRKPSVITPSKSIDVLTEVDTTKYFNKVSFFGGEEFIENRKTFLLTMEGSSLPKLKKGFLYKELRNLLLELCFPEQSQKELHKLLTKINIIGGGYKSDNERVKVTFVLQLEGTELSVPLNIKAKVEVKEASEKSLLKSLDFLGYEVQKNASMYAYLPEVRKLNYFDRVKLPKEEATKLGVKKKGIPKIPSADKIFKEAEEAAKEKVSKAMVEEFFPSFNLERELEEVEKTVSLLSKYAKQNYCLVFYYNGNKIHYSNSKFWDGSFSVNIPKDKFQTILEGGFFSYEPIKGE